MTAVLLEVARAGLAEELDVEMLPLPTELSPREKASSPFRMAVAVAVALIAAAIVPNGRGLDDRRRQVPDWLCGG